MSLIRCPECNRKISNKAEQCIHCGYPLNKSEDSFDKINIEQSIEKSDDLCKDGNESDHNENVPTAKFSLSRKISIGIVCAMGMLLVAVILILVINTEIENRKYSKSLTKFYSEQTMLDELGGVWRKTNSSSYQELCFSGDSMMVWSNHFSNTDEEYDCRIIYNWDANFDESTVDIDDYKIHIFYGSPQKESYVIRKNENGTYLTNIESRKDEYIKISADTSKAMDYYDACGKAKRVVYDYCDLLKSKQSSINSIDFFNAYTVDNGNYHFEYKVVYSDYQIRYGLINVFYRNGKYEVDGGITYLY